jgi:type II secretory pathway pseudopilin PulG
VRLISEGSEDSTVRRIHGSLLAGLLVAVAVVSALAAIAAQGMLEAETRAKVARVNADLRDLAVASEAYFVDHGIYPPSTSGGAQLRGFPEQVNGQFVSGTLWVDLSTPVAYIGNAFLIDHFALPDGGDLPEDGAVYTYQNMLNNYCGHLLQGEPRFSSAFCEAALDFYGAWRIGSVGPDGDFTIPRAPVPTAQTPYDPTNGTLSAGNIWRSQIHPENDMPDSPDLVGGL